MKKWDKTYRWVMTGQERRIFIDWTKAFMENWEFGGSGELRDDLVFITLVRIVRLMDKDTFYRADDSDQYYYDLQLEHLLCLERMTRIIQVHIGEENHVQRAFQKMNTDINFLMNKPKDDGKETADQDRNSRGREIQDSEDIEGAPAGRGTKDRDSESGVQVIPD